MNNATCTVGFPLQWNECMLFSIFLLLIGDSKYWNSEGKVFPQGT